MFNDGWLCPCNSVMNSTTGNGKTFTFSAWVKRGYYDTEQYLFHCKILIEEILQDWNSILPIDLNLEDIVQHILKPVHFRDITAWMHILNG